MGVFNIEGYFVLVISNKSELVVGYFMLYGDSVGGFVFLKDVLKLFVWELVCWCNVEVW